MIVRQSSNTAKKRVAVRWLVLGGLVASSAACTTIQDEPADALALSVPKDGYQALTYKYLPAYKHVRLAVDRHDQSIALADGGRSFAEALVLPRMPIPYRIDVQTEIQAAGDDQSTSAFLPSLTFLDSTKRPIRTVNELVTRYRANTVKSSVLNSAITVGNDLSHARYLVVHTNPENQGYSMSLKDSDGRLKSGNFNTMVYAPVTKARYRVDFGQEGWISLRVQPLEKQPRLRRVKKADPVQQQRLPQKQKKERFRWLKGLFS